EIEPVMRAARYANEVARLDLERENGLALGMDVEEAAALDDEGHLVLVVQVLAREALEHGVEVRRLRLHVDDIGNNVAAARLEVVDLGRPRREDLVGRGRARHTRRVAGPLVLNAVLGEKATDGLGVGDRAILVRNPEQCHAVLPVTCTSRTSPCARPPPTGTPQSCYSRPPQ